MARTLSTRYYAYWRSNDATGDATGPTAAVKSMTMIGQTKGKSPCRTT
jgi:hypothetical protein